MAGNRNVGDTVMGGLQWLLNISSDIRRDEVVDVLLFLANLFVVLVAYYVIKTVREPLILAGGGSPELKSYAAAIQTLVLAGYAPVYAWVTNRVSRLRLTVGLVLFFILCVQLFYAFGAFGAPNVFGALAGGEGGVAGWLADNVTLGLVFYVWVGIFSLSTIAQFWSYANDVYDEEEGKRIFPVVAIGATAGAPVGSTVAWYLSESGVGPYASLQASAGLLLVHLGLYYWTEMRYRAARGGASSSEARGEDEAGEEETASEKEERGGFELIVENRYLQWIALFFVLLNLVNTTGEYILSVYIKDAGQAAVEAGTAASVENYIQGFYGEFYSIVNVVTMLVQTLLVARLVEYTGMAGVIFALPIISLCANGLAAMGVGLSTYRWAKTAENSTDYSVMNTTRALLWLPTTRAEKFSAKQTIDTFFVRFGDTFSAAVVFVGTTWLSFAPRDFAYTNLVLVVLWMMVGGLMLRSFWRQSEEHDISAEDLEEVAEDAGKEG